MAFSILINWKKNTLQITVKQISKIIVVAFIFCLFLNLLTKFEFNFVLLVMLFLILLPAISVFSLILKPNNFKKIKFNYLINKSGMYFSHIGVAVFAFGVLYVNSFDIESDSKISIGEKMIFQIEWILSPTVMGETQFSKLLLLRKLICQL